MSQEQVLLQCLSDRLKEMQTVVGGELKIATIYSIGLHELPRNLKALPAVEVGVEYLQCAQVYQKVAEGGANLRLVHFQLDGKRSGSKATEKISWS